MRDTLSLTTVLLIFLLGVLGNALIGGVLPAAVAAVIAGLLANFLFTPPFGSFTITEPENVFALVVFVVVGVTVASVVDRSATRARQAAQGRAEAQLVAAAATSVLNSADPVHAVLEQARVGFGMRSVALLAAAGRHTVVSTAGPTSGRRRDRRPPTPPAARRARRRAGTAGSRTCRRRGARPDRRNRAGPSRCTAGHCHRPTANSSRSSPPRPRSPPNAIG